MGGKLPRGQCLSSPAAQTQWGRAVPFCWVGTMPSPDSQSQGGLESEFCWKEQLGFSLGSTATNSMF